MRTFRLTVQAEQDIDDIASYTTENLGWRQTVRYLNRLEDGFELLAQNPLIGRTCEGIRPGLRRFEIGHHVAFFVIEGESILVARVLHERMLPTKYV